MHVRQSISYNVQDPPMGHSDKETNRIFKIKDRIEQAKSRLDALNHSLGDSVHHNEVYPRDRASGGSPSSSGMVGHPRESYKVSYQHTQHSPEPSTDTITKGYLHNRENIRISTSVTSGAESGSVHRHYNPNVQQPKREAPIPSTQSVLMSPDDRQAVSRHLQLPKQPTSLYDSPPVLQVSDSPPAHLGHTGHPPLTSGRSSYERNEDEQEERIKRYRENKNQQSKNILSSLSPNNRSIYRQNQPSCNYGTNREQSYHRPQTSGSEGSNEPRSMTLDQMQSALRARVDSLRDSNGYRINIEEVVGREAQRTRGRIVDPESPRTSRSNKNDKVDHNQSKDRHYQYNKEQSQHDRSFRERKEKYSTKQDTRTTRSTSRCGNVDIKFSIRNDSLTNTSTSSKGTRGRSLSPSTRSPARSAGKTPSTKKRLTTLQSPTTADIVHKQQQKQKKMIPTMMSGAEIFAVLRLRGIIISKGDTGERQLPNTRCHQMELSEDEFVQLKQLRKALEQGTNKPPVGNNAPNRSSELLSVSTTIRSDQQRPIRSWKV